MALSPEPARAVTSSEVAPVRTRLQRARIFVLLGGLTAFGPLSIDMYLPSLPAIGRDLAASESVIQLTLPACLVGLALGQILAGPLSDRFGRRRPLLAGVAAYVLASLLCATAPVAPVLVGFRLVQGLAGAAGIVIARAIVRDLYVRSAAARYFSRLVLIMGLAPILAPVIGAQVLRFTSWHGLFLTLAFVAALLSLGAAVAWRRDGVGRDRRQRPAVDGSDRLRWLGRDLASAVLPGFEQRVGRAQRHRARAHEATKRRRDRVSLAGRHSERRRSHRCATRWGRRDQLGAADGGRDRRFRYRSRCRVHAHVGRSQPTGDAGQLASRVSTRMKTSEACTIFSVRLFGMCIRTPGCAAVPKSHPSRYLARTSAIVLTAAVLDPFVIQTVGSRAVA